MKNYLLSLVSIFLSCYALVSPQTQAEIADDICVIIDNLRVPKEFISDLENGIYFDIALQEHIQSINAAKPKGVWHQTIVRDNEAPDWVLSLPDLSDRMEQWRVINWMSPGFVDECGLPVPPEE
jgi:hypothetical protein